MFVGVPSYPAAHATVAVSPSSVVPVMVYSSGVGFFNAQSEMNLKRYVH